MPRRGDPARRHELGGGGESQGAGDIPQPVRRFVCDHIDSVRMVELLLLLESEPERAWTPAELSAELRSHLVWTVERLESLRARGLVAREGRREPRYRYAVPSRATRSAIRQLGHAFATRRVQLVSLVYTRGRGSLDELHL